MKSTQADLFPPEIISLTRLVWLEFGSHFHSLPDSIGDLRNLVILELVSDKLVELPISIENLTKLQHLSLELESLEKLPSSFGKLSNLTDLYLWNLSWKSLPPVLFELEKLRYLWIKDNKNFQGQLEELSDDIGNLTELRDLQLNGQQLSELPDVFHLLQQLQVLKLGSNQIQSLPLSITQLSSLRRLELYFNPIKELPKALGKIEQLEHLDISDTKVTELPESFGMLQNLSVLDAVGCNLVNLPSSILNLKPEQFSQFHISLRLPRKDLSLPVKNWLCQLDQHASEVEEVSVAIELFQHETGSSQSDEVLLEENEIDAIIEGQEKLKVQFKMTLRQIFINDLAHLPLHTLLESIPMDHVYDRPSGTQHSMYDLLYHINIALQDMISYFQDPKYHPPEWPDEYWDNSDIPQSSSLPATEIIQELLEEIEEAYDFFISILDDPEHDIIDSVPSNPDHTILRQLLIFATHTSYHLGQLALLIDLFE